MEVYLVVIDRSLRGTTKKGRQLFFEEKVHPRQNPGYAYHASSPRYGMPDVGSSRRTSCENM